MTLNHRNDIELTEYFETVSISELRPLVALNYEDAPAELLDYYLRESYIRFCKDTGILERSIVFNSQLGLFDYLLSVPDEYSINEIVNVRDEKRHYSHQLSDCSLSHYCFRYKKGIVYFGSQPNGMITIEAKVIPTRNSCLMDKDIYDNYSDAIKYSFDHTLMGSNLKKWRNAAGSSNAYNLYRLEVENAKERKKRGNVSRKVYYDKNTVSLALSNINIGRR